MGTGIEWDPPAVSMPGAESAEVLEFGRERRSPLIARCALALLAVLALGFAYRADTAPVPGSGHAAGAANAGVGPNGATAPLPGQLQMASIEAAVATPGPLLDYVRQTSTHDACASVEVGQSPQRVIAAAVHRALPEFVVRDVSRTLNQFTDLCALDIRATDSHGSTLVVQVVAPRPGDSRAFTAITVGTRRQSPTTMLSMAAAVNRTGWSIVIGVIGSMDDEPTSTELLQVVQDPSVPW